MNVINTDNHILNDNLATKATTVPFLFFICIELMSFKDSLIFYFHFIINFFLIFTFIKHNYKTNNIKQNVFLFALTNSFMIKN